MRWFACLVIVLFVGCDLPDLREGEVKPASQGREASFGVQSSVRIATWNVRNLFDAIDDPNSDEVLSQSEYAQKVSELVRVIDEVDPDFLGLQEIENERCLKELNSLLARPFPQGGLIEGNDRQRGIDVAFLSRLPVAKVISHADLVLPVHPDTPKRYHFSRDCLEVQLQTEPQTTVLVNHFKSQRGDQKRSAAKRRVQSLGVVNLLEELDESKERAMIVLGDLNDRPDSWSLEPLLGQLHDAFKTYPESERVTHRSRRGGTNLDYILLDDEARELVGKGLIWKDIARKTSDHNPVSLELSLGIPDEPVEEKFWSRGDR